MFLTRIDLDPRAEQGREWCDGQPSRPVDRRAGKVQGKTRPGPATPVTVSTSLELDQLDTFLTSNGPPAISGWIGSRVEFYNFGSDN